MAIGPPLCSRARFNPAGVWPSAQLFGQRHPKGTASSIVSSTLNLIQEQCGRFEIHLVRAGSVSRWLDCPRLRSGRPVAGRIVHRDVLLSTPRRDSFRFRRGAHLRGCIPASERYLWISRCFAGKALEAEQVDCAHGTQAAEEGRGR